MALPRAGLFVIWYNWSASSDTFIDRNVNEFTSLNLSNINPSFPNVGRNWGSTPLPSSSASHEKAGIAPAEPRQ